jgi:hypothetical protein
MTVAHNSEAMQKVGVAAKDTVFQPGTRDMRAIAKPADAPTTSPPTIELISTLEPASPLGWTRRIWVVSC